MNNNNCDGSGPHTPGQVRVLPCGGAGNLILCLRCYQNEITHRKHANKERKRRHIGDPIELPRWETLKIYGQDEAPSAAPESAPLEIFMRGVLKADCIHTEAKYFRECLVIVSRFLTAKQQTRLANKPEFARLQNNAQQLAETE